MHDPMTVAHEIKYPWFSIKPWPKNKRRDPNPWNMKREWEEFTDEQKADRSRQWPGGYRDTFITIWHVDPETDGSDNSCGFGYVKITKKQREILRNASWAEGRNPHYLCCNEKEWDGTLADAESLTRGLFLLVARVLRLPMTFDQAAKYASEHLHIRDVQKAGSTFCFVVGYHTNGKTDKAEDREEHFQGILASVARIILTDRRPWYKHPKWHFWHWKIQCHPIQNFKRWAFSRCCKCGGRFKWGGSCVSNQWDGTGPMWFQSEQHLMHEKCSMVEVCQKTTAN